MRKQKWNKAIEGNHMFFFSFFFLKIAGEDRRRVMYPAGVELQDLPTTT